MKLFLEGYQKGGGKWHEGGRSLRFSVKERLFCVSQKVELPGEKVALGEDLKEKSSKSSKEKEENPAS